MPAVDLSDIRRRMDASLDSLKKDLSSLRTGRANATLLDPVTVDAYGSIMPLTQCATVSVPEPRMISVTVWDKALTKAVEKAIRDSGLGLNPSAEGTVVRVPIPELNEERRNELAKAAGRYAEAARVAIRNVRRDGMEMVKKMEKDSKIGQDDAVKSSEEIQKLTDTTIKAADALLVSKEKEIRQV